MAMLTLLTFRLYAPLLIIHEMRVDPKAAMTLVAYAQPQPQLPSQLTTTSIDGTSGGRVTDGYTYSEE
jgi:hypothetical protein